MNIKEFLFTKFNLILLLFWILSVALGYFKPEGIYHILLLIPLGILWAYILILYHKKI